MRYKTARKKNAVFLRLRAPVFYAAAAFAALAALSACVTEPEALLHPQCRDTTRARFLQFIDDGQTRRIRFESVPEDTAGYADPAYRAFTEVGGTFGIGCRDSLHAEIYVRQTPTATATIEYSTKAAGRFRPTLSPRGGFQTIIATANVSTDSLSTLGIIGEPESRPRGEASARVFNAIRATDNSVTVVLGCPGGVELASKLPYRGVSAAVKITPDNAATFSVVRNGAIAGTYSFSASSNNDYLIIPYLQDGKQDGKILVRALNERGGANGLPIEEKVSVVAAPATATLRLANLSGARLTLAKAGASIAQAEPLAASSAPATVCASQTADTLTATNGKDSLALPVTLAPNKQYLILAADSLGRGLRGAALEQSAPPPTGYSRIRVANFVGDQPSLTFLLGARKTTVGGLSTGTTLAKNLAFGAVSDAVDVPAGYLPVMAYSTGSPQQIVHAAFAAAALEGKRYVLAATKGADGATEFRLLDEDDPKPAQTLRQGTLAQIFNAAPANDSAVVSVPAAKLSDVAIGYGALLATVVPPSELKISVEGSSANFDFSRRQLVVLYPEGNQTKIVAKATTAPQKGVVWRRVANVVEGLSVSVASGNWGAADSVDVSQRWRADGVPFKGFSQPSSSSEQKREEYLFWKSSAGSGVVTRSQDVLLSVRDALLTLDKSYTLLFAPRREEGAYVMFIIQE